MMMDRASLFALALCTLAGCSSPSSTPDTGTIPGTDGGGGGGNDAGGGGGNDGGGGGTDTGGGGGGFTCTQGTLFAGHPSFDAEPGIHANEGDPLTGVEGRPLGFREVIFVGSHLVTVVGAEVWSADLSASAPTVHRIAGDANGARALLDGPCSGASFANLQDVAADAAGALYVMDQTGNAILQITDPFDPASCAVHYWAGTSVDVPSIDINDPPNVGNTDGAGLSAQFALPGRMAIASDGTLYVWDDENDSIRAIAADAAHTVSTLATGVDALVDGLVVLGDQLYVYAHDTGGEVYVEGIARTGGARHDVLRGDSGTFGLSGSLELGGLTTDGTDLFLFFKGIVFQVTPSGTITPVAGADRTDTGNFDTDYDPAAAHPAAELQLANRAQFATAGAAAWLVFDASGNLYFIGQELDPYVERIACHR